MGKRAEPWPSDRELVEKILGGSREHFDLLYNSYFPRVYRFALKRLGDSAEAEDVTQEVFITVLRVLGSYRGDSSLLVWIFGITRNTANRRLRRTARRLVPLDPSESAGIPATDALPDQTVDARRMLRRCEDVVANDLTPLQRRIFHLKHLRRQPVRTIARSLGKTEDAVKANLYRMRRALLEGAPGLAGLLGARSPLG